MCPIRHSIKLYYSVSLIFANFAYKSCPKMALFIIAILLCKMALLYDQPVLEISFDEDMNASLVPDSKPFKEDALGVLLQVANLPEEPMETDILADLLPQPDPELEPKLVFPPDSWGITKDVFQLSEVDNAAFSDSELSSDDFQVPVNNLPLMQIPFPNHGHAHLQLPQLNHCQFRHSSMARNKKTECRWKTRNYTMQNGLL